MPGIWVVGEIADGGLARISTEVATLARGLGETAGHSAPPARPLSPLAATNVIPVCPAGVVKWEDD